MPIDLSPRLRAPLQWLALLVLAACGPVHEGGPAYGDAPPPRPLSDPAAERWVSLAPGEALADVEFAGILPDDAAEALLRRHGVRAFAVYSVVRGEPRYFSVPPDSAAPGLVPRARAHAAARAGDFPCQMQARLRQVAAADPHVRGADGPPLAAVRLLHTIETARLRREALLGGDPVAYGVRVVGSEAALAALERDPEVRRVHVVERERGTGAWPDPRPEVPGRLDPRAPLPEVAALTPGEIRARFARLMEEPLPGCEAELRNIEANEPGEPARPVRGGDAYEAGGLVFRARVQAVPQEPHRGSASGGGAVTVTVTATNPGDRRIETGIRGCTVLLRAHAGTRPDGPPAWDGSRGIGCAAAASTLALDPGESREFTAVTDQWRVLGDDLPFGTYHFTALFRLAERTVEIPAGAVRFESPHDGLRLRATSEVTGGELRASATVVNVSDRDQQVEFGACALRLRARPASDPDGPPVWRSERRQPWDGAIGYACADILLVATLAPGDSLQRFALRIPLIEVLGDSLPDGRFEIDAVLGLNFRETRPIPAGAVELALPREPLPRMRRVEVSTYRAETAVAGTGGGAVVTARVRETLTGAGGAIRRISADCPVVLHAYRDRARRDRGPLGGEPDWTSHGACGSDVVEYALNAGQSRDLVVRASAAEILGEALPPGRYYFAAVVHLPGRRIFLSAGDADLRR
jgi:hypothetical protein